MRAGTLLADYVRGPDLSGFAEPVALGIALHRRIDALVDTHPDMARLKALVDPPLRRYAGILFDVFFDHVLIGDWPRSTNADLGSFAAEVYASLARAAPLLNPPAREFAARMRRYDTLTSCATTDGVSRTLSRIAQRLKRPVDLASGIVVLERNADELARSLPPIFDELADAARAYLGSTRRTLPSELSVSR